jgi:outer membrane lipoprotein-sorting protein
MWGGSLPSPVFSYITLMMNRFIFALFLVISLAFAAPPVSAQDSANASDKAVAAAQSYLQSLKTAQARFVQTANDGRQAAGTFYLDRPGKLRFEYDPPYKDLVVADGIFIYFYDSETKQESNALINQTLADFLLRKRLNLGGDVAVTSVAHSTKGDLLITLIESGNASAGSLTLVFEEKPALKLKKWRVVDSTKTITEIELSELQTGMKLPASLFVYKNPGRSKYN